MHVRKGVISKHCNCIPKFDFSAVFQRVGRNICNFSIVIKKNTLLFFTKMWLYFCKYLLQFFCYLYECVRAFASSLYAENSWDNKHIGMVFRQCERYGCAVPFPTSEQSWIHIAHRQMDVHRCERVDALPCCPFAKNSCCKNHTRTV